MGTPNSQKKKKKEKIILFPEYIWAPSVATYIYTVADPAMFQVGPGLPQIPDDQGNGAL
jgi:hypothetical protein